MKNRTKDILSASLFILLQLIIVGAAFAAGYYAHRYIAIPSGKFAVLEQAYQLLLDYAYDDLPSAKKLEYGMIRGLLLETKDPYTSFVEPPQAELQTNQLAGRYGGIGVRLEKDTDGNYRLFPFPDSPAAESGIQDADLLAAVDELQVNQETPVEDIQAAVRGPVGTEVEITYMRQPDTSERVATIQRQEVPLPSVTYNLTVEDETVGIVRASIIAESTPREIADAIHNLSERGAERYILDLRDNYGGLVDAGANTARMFLASGEILKQQYKDQAPQTFRVETPGEFRDIPLIILVNNGTASAAEIVAGALQGQKRAKLVGLPTYGKDSVQLVFDLQDQSSLHVTSARWWIPGLDLPKNGQGLLPDIQLTPEQMQSPELIGLVIKELSMP